VPIQITHQSFQTTHYFDVLVDNGGPFELKTVEALAPYHPAQLLHYLLLTGLAHGKLVNLGIRPPIFLPKIFPSGTTCAASPE